MTELLITSILAFISTNLDDIFILMLFFGSRKYQSSHIVIGQYLGILALVALSYLLSRVGNFIDARYISLLGLFPVFLAIKQFIQLLKPGTEENNIDLTKTGVLAVAGVTMANGSDNIGVYVPLFVNLNMANLVVLIIVFIVMTALWCFLGKYLASHPLLAKPIEKYGHMIMPIVLLLLGVYILIEGNVITLIQ